MKEKKAIQSKLQPQSRNSKIAQFSVTLISVIIFITVALVSLYSINELKGEARVVIYAGIVRGGSQKLFKMETYAFYTDPALDLEKRDNLTARLDDIIDSLTNGGEVEADGKELIKLNDPTFQDDMAQIRVSFDEIKLEIQAIRKGKDPAEFFALTETYFALTNKTVGDAEDFSQRQLEKNIKIFILTCAVFLVFVLGAIVFFNIAQKRKSKNAHLSQIAENAERESNAKSSFLANMSHEIRTPLNAIIGMATYADQQDDPTKIKDSIAEILKASDHLLGVVSDILDISKIQSGKFELGNEAFNLNLALDEVGSMINERAEAKKIEFQEEIDLYHDTWVMGDKPRFKQVLINLLGNAVKFTPQDGNVKIYVKSIRDTSTNSVRCLFSVEDNGIGMTEEEVSRLFKSFSQADPNTSLKYGGTGLGLAISQSIVNEMGGEISVISEPEKGSVFSFELTFEITKTQLPEKEDDMFPDLTGKRLLLVDDMEANRLIVSVLLESTHVEIDEVENGKLALDSISYSPPNHYDIVFMDTRMPIMDGYQSTRAIRELAEKGRPDLANLPIISMSANAFREDINAAFAAGMNDYIIKPIEIKRLAKVLGNYFG
jgi:signal transduction histidine kinase/CheY-like chemotaxis protein